MLSFMCNKNDEIYSFAKILIVAFIAICLYFIFASLIVSTGYSTDGILGTIDISISIIIAVIVFTTCIEKKKLSDISIKFRKVDIVFFIIGLLLAALFIVFLVLLLQSLTGATLKITNLNASKLITFLLIAITQEVLFRAFLLNNTFTKLSFNIRSVIGALLFAIPYILSQNNYIFSIILPIIFAIFANYITKYTKSIWFSIAFNFALNFSLNAIFMCNTNTESIIGLLPIIFIFLCIPTILISKNENS